MNINRVDTSSDPGFRHLGDSEQILLEIYDLKGGLKVRNEKGEEIITDKYSSYKIILNQDLDRFSGARNFNFRGYKKSLEQIIIK